MAAGLVNRRVVGAEGITTALNKVRIHLECGHDVIFDTSLHNITPPSVGGVTHCERCVDEGDNDAKD